MLPKFYALASGVLILVAVFFFNNPGYARVECQQLIQQYANGATLPERADPMRARYVECYYMICGIRLDL